MYIAVRPKLQQLDRIPTDLYERLFNMLIFVHQKTHPSLMQRSGRSEPLPTKYLRLTYPASTQKLVWSYETGYKLKD